MASQYGTEHEEFDLNPETDLPDAIEQFADHFDEPNADGGALPVWFLSKLTKRSVTVALSGEGADEIFGGYLTYRANALARAARKLPRFALRAGAFRGASDPRFRRQDQLRVQAETFPFRYVAAPCARSRSLERNLL